VKARNTPRLLSLSAANRPKKEKKKARSTKPRSVTSLLKRRASSGASSPAETAAPHAYTIIALDAQRSASPCSQPPF
jgi:hypothetical protein